jgi:hypothetical protein
MPGLDRTGPEGQGSQTGRRLGKCSPDNRINQAGNKEDNNREVTEGKPGNERNTEQHFGDGRGRGPWGGGRGPGGRGRRRRLRGGQQ